MSKLSIIIPYYNGGKYTEELLDCLDSQITDDVEVILVDDGSPEPFKTGYRWCKVIRQENKRCAGARNTGLDHAKGDYIQFIDSDDMVPDYFIRRLLREIAETPFDVCDYSWRSLDLGGVQHNYQIQAKTGRLHNPSVCTRCFSKAYIGDNRFNTKKDSTEDEDFSRKLGYLTDSHVHTAISEYMYYYRTSADNSKIKRFKQGLMHTKRIAYYYNHVTADMDWLLEEIKKEDQDNEVWLLTNQCDIPELSKYCQISAPKQIWTHENRGEPYRFIVINPPVKTQIAIYCEYSATVGGIPTFIYNFCRHMHKYYDIVVVYEKFSDIQISRLSEVVETIKYDPDTSICCDTLILNRLNDEIKLNIIYKQSIQICHACRQINFRIPADRDILVNVSEASKASWGEESKDGIVIHNLPYVVKKECLLLVSATRVNAMDKGANDARMKRLAEMLDEADIKYIWLNFADGSLRDMPQSFINMPAQADVQPYIAKADYLVQLSDAEAYSMSILEALCLNTAVIATPFPSLFEEGFIDGQTGYIVPFDMDFDVRKLLDVPEFDYLCDMDSIIKQWRELLGYKKPERKYDPQEKICVICLHKYFDKLLKRYVNVGERIMVTKPRAEVICNAGYGKRGK